MHILMVNDDGFDSEALRTLCRAAAARGHRVTVCAPSTQQSAKGHSFTVFTPLIVHERAMEGAQAAWAIDGTPVDCTRLGLMALCQEPVDVVMSGINKGYNAGLATYVSGTVGAAREAAFQGKAAMAVSMHAAASRETMCFFADWAVTLAERLAAYPYPRLSVCNINVPAVPVYELQEPVMCPISTENWVDDYERRKSPRGDVYFWLEPENFDGEQPTPGSDLYWLQRKHITCTFLAPDGAGQDAYRDFLDF